MKILETVRLFSQKTSVSARDFLSLLGQLNAAADFVMLGWLHLRPLQVSLRNQWRPQNLPYSHQIRMTSEILHHLKWWLQEDLYHQGIPLKIDPPSHTIFTDASLSGWGAHVEPKGLLFHGVWTEDQSRLHINVLGMKAIFLSLSRAVHTVKNSTVLISTDNTTVVAYIRHQGGTHSTELSEEVWSVLNLCLNQHKTTSKQSLRDRQFSSDVAEHVSKARRVSTVKVYDAKWQIFRRWADQRKIDPIQATPQIVADFLTFLFSVKKCQVSTIKGYRSTISNTLKYKTGYDFGSHPVLSELIKSFAIQRPVDRPLAPKWDLAFVLTHMCKAPFEPLDKASLFYLSVKTVFLVTLAMARRVSEVHALSIESDHLRFSNLDGSLILRTQVGFLAKNQLPSRAPDSIIIPKLSNFCCKSDNLNRMLCPVRAVKIYLNKTKSLRKHRKRLFIPIRGDQDLAKSTLSRWVRYAIKHAYSSISKNPSRLLKPRAHELRALSTSWAYVNYIPLEEILKSAVWSSSSLFASHYLRDFREQTENLRAMGPIIAAQKVVGGRSNLATHEDK